MIYAIARLNILAPGSTPSRRGILDYAPACGSWRLQLGERENPAARRGMLSIKIEKTERSPRLVGVAAPAPRRAIPQIFNLQSSIFNIQFPDKSGFTLRDNPASGISASLRPAKLVPVGLKPFLASVLYNFKCFYFDSMPVFGFDINYVFIKYAAE